MKTWSTIKLQNKLVVLIGFWLFCWVFSRYILISSDFPEHSSESHNSEDDIETSLRPPHLLSGKSEKESAAFDFNSSKKILYFNNYFHLTDWRFGFGHQPFISANCPQSNCFVTNDRKILPSLAEFDAILFHARDMDRRVIQVFTVSRTSNDCLSFV